MKHALLTRILVHLCAKPSPFRVIDTHAGVGLYDLAGAEAVRTGEWRGGIGRLEQPLDAAAEAVLAPFRSVLEEVRRRHGPDAYPGSPALAHHFLRDADRALVIEKHPDDAATLASRMKHAGGVKVLTGDGWAMLPGLLPPVERRGLVLIDPPYEEAGEFDRLPGRFAKAHRKWPTGILALWYPIKDGGAVDRFVASLAEPLSAPALRLELLVDRPDTPTRLNGCGMIVVNPPWRLVEEAGALLPALAARLSRGDHGGYRCEDLRPAPSS